MTWPTVAVTTTNTDAAADSPALARADIQDALTKLNQMMAHVSTFAATLLDDTTQAQAQATLGIQSIGVGQYWTSQNGYRSLATTYTNNTGKPIFVRVSVLCNSGTQRIYFLIDGAGASWNTVVSGAYGSTSFIVPNGHTYRVEATSCTLDNWFELTA